jgi:hypothetical protein
VKTNSAHLDQIGERGVVSDEDGCRLEVRDDVLKDSGGDGLSIARRRASSELVENNLSSPRGSSALTFGREDRGELTKDLGVAILRISLHSLISTMKVLLPRAISSEAPMRVRIESNRLVVQDSAGT